MTARRAFSYPPAVGSPAPSEVRVADTNVHIEVFVDRNFGENAYVVYAAGAEDARVGWVIDPSFPPQPDRIRRFVESENITIEKIILTHGHLDHVAGLDEMKRAWPDAPVYMPKGEHAALHDATMNLSAGYGLQIVLDSRADHDLAPGDELELGPTRWRVLDTSGHSPAGRTLYCAEAGMAIVGDALFEGSVGRCDLPGADYDTLLRHIRENLLTLPPQTAVFSGHGPVTTIEKEQKSNPFLAE